MSDSHLKLYRPHKLQLKFHNSNARFRVAACGRQFGKSTMCNNELANKAWVYKNTKYGFISPIFSQSKEQFRRAILALPREALKKKSETELRIEFINGSTIEYLSGDNPHSLRGKTFHGIIVDEVRDQSPELWSQVIRPMLATTSGFAAFVSTPNGFDTFFDLFERARTEPNWECFQSPSTSNPLFTQVEADLARREMSDMEYKQEIEAEFVNLTQGSAYYNFGSWNLSETSPFYSKGIIAPHLPIELCMDFNVRPLSWSMGQYRQGYGHYFFDEIFMSGTRSNTSEGIQEYISRHKEYGITAEPAVILVGDATGKALKTSSSGQTDYTIVMQALDEAGIKYVNLTPESNPHVKDRVNTVNARLKSADGKVQLWVHPTKCKNLKKDFERVCWKEGATAILDQTTDPMLTHLSDGVGYNVCVRNPIEKNDVGRLRILRR